MSNPTWNGATLPVAGDAWNYIPDLTKAFNTAGLVITVATQALRDGLAALAPGGVLPVGTVVYRSDINVLEIWNGSSWYRHFLSAFIDWTTPGVFGNGFTTYTGSGYDGVKYTLMDNWLHVSGAAINAGTWASGVAICALPSNVIPSRKIVGVNCIVDTAGNVLTTTTGTNTTTTVFAQYRLG